MSARGIRVIVIGTHVTWRPSLEGREREERELPVGRTEGWMRGWERGKEGGF